MKRETASQGSSRPTSAGLSVGIGLALSTLVAASVGLLDALRMARGSYELGIADVIAVSAAYGLAGLVLTVPWLFLAAVAAFGLIQAPGWLFSRPSTRFILPLVTLSLLIGLLVNKIWLRGLFSPSSIVSNIGLVGLAFLAGWILQRYVAARVAAFMALASLWVVASLIFLAVGGSPEAVVPGPAKPAGDAPTLVVVVIDTLRSDHLGAYGYGLDTSPEFDHLAEQSTLFERAFSNSNWTRPAVASLMTSTLPSQHGLTEQGRALPRDLPLVAELLRRNGYRTGFFTSNPNVEPEDGYFRGVDTFVRFTNRGFVGRTLLVQDVLDKDAPKLAALLRQLIEGKQRSSYSPKSLTDSALAWLEKTNRPSFAYLHYVGAHDPYLPPLEHADRVGASSVENRVSRPPEGWAGRDALPEADRIQMMLQYDGEVLWHDAEIGRLFRELSQRDRVVLLVTSDHGEGFGEHGVWGHGSGMFDEVARIPLLIWCRPSCASPGRDPHSRSLLDIAPTLLELADIEPPPSFLGSSLLRALETGSAAPVVIENPAQGEYSIRADEWNLALRSRRGTRDVWLWRSGQESVFLDPVVHESVRRELEAQLNAALEYAASRAVEGEVLDISDERREELRALGYLD